MGEEKDSSLFLNIGMFKDTSDDKWYNYIVKQYCGTNVERNANENVNRNRQLNTVINYNNIFENRLHSNLSNSIFIFP